MCSWCYGFSRTLKSLTEQLADSIEITRLLGGLAADSDAPMSDDTQKNIISNWQRIEQSIAGVTFNYDFWEKCQPRRSTYPCCRAVISAREQGKKFDIMMTEAIQQAYYQQARNPSEVATLIELADELSLDVDRFTRSINSAQTESVLQAELRQTSELGVSSYPDLRLRIDASIWPVAIDYNDADAMLGLIDSLLS
jgi:putative protein-disulfide isomerase